MSNRERTFIHKDCDQEVFGVLFSRFPNHRKVGEDGHAFFSSTLATVLDDDTFSYDRIDLKQEEMTGQELYELIYYKIGEEGYLGAIETTQAQAGLVQEYSSTINPAEGEA